MRPGSGAAFASMSRFPLGLTAKIGSTGQAYPTDSPSSTSYSLSGHSPRRPCLLGRRRAVPASLRWRALVGLAVRVLLFARAARLDVAVVVALAGRVGHRQAHQLEGAEGDVRHPLAPAFFVLAGDERSG